MKPDKHGNQAFGVPMPEIRGGVKVKRMTYKKVWIVGGNSKTSDGWAFMGVFSSLKKAIQAAKKGKSCKFIGPAILDMALSEKPIEWPGSYWVRRKK